MKGSFVMRYAIVANVDYRKPEDKSWIKEIIQNGWTWTKKEEEKLIFDKKQKKVMDDLVQNLLNNSTALNVHIEEVE